MKSSENTYRKISAREGLLAAAFLISLFTLPIITSCARMGSPDGGWYDDTPPQVLSSTPADKGVNVHVSSLGDSAVMIEAFGWVPASEYLSSKWYILEEVKLQYDAEGIKIPYPQMDVHLDPSKGQEALPNRITAEKAE